MTEMSYEELKRAYEQERAINDALCKEKKELVEQYERVSDQYRRMSAPMTDISDDCLAAAAAYIEGTDCDYDPKNVVDALKTLAAKEVVARYDQIETECFKLRQEVANLKDVLEDKTHELEDVRKARKRLDTIVKGCFSDAAVAAAKVQLLRPDMGCKWDDHENVRMALMKALETGKRYV